MNGEQFINFVNDNYFDIKNKFLTATSLNTINEDIFHDTVLKCYDLLNEDKIDINNTKVITDLCNVELTLTKNLLPIYDEKINAYDYLKYLCNKGLNKRLNNSISDEYKERLLYELDVIKNMGFSDYFLIVYDYVKFAKKNKILVGPGRGSAAGSLVAYSLGITDIDPLELFPVLKEADITDTSCNSSIGESLPIRTDTPSSKPIGSKTPWHVSALSPGFTSTCFECKHLGQ